MLLQGAVAALVRTTWNPSDKGANVALSAGNLTATASGSAGARATSSRSGGKWRFEITIQHAPSGFLSIGLASATWTLAGGLGVSGFTSVGLDPTGKVLINGSQVASAPGYGNGYVIGIEHDADAHTAYFQSGSATPSAAVDVSGLTGGSLLPAIFVGTSDVLTVNFGASAFSYASNPAGYNPWT